MRTSKVFAVALGVLAAAATAEACMFGTPWQLLDARQETLTAAPTNSFAWEVSHWVRPSPWIAAGREKTAPVAPDDARNAVENAGLSAVQKSALAAMRAAPDGASALAAGGGFPIGVALYTAGAVAFAHNDLAGAAGYFDRVVKLPAELAAPRLVWAQFMLGRIAASKDDAAAAETAFAKTRALVVGGAADPLDLATGSLGESARLRLDAGDIAGAVALYGQQAADGSDEAVQSLRMVAEAIMSHPDTFPQRVAEPATQRLLVVHALALTGDYLHALHTGGALYEISYDGFFPQDDLDLTGLRALFSAIGKNGIVVTQVDRLAALAYRLGDYQAAEALAEKAQGPLALWIRAKVGLQNDPSPRLFVEALRALSDASADSALEPSSGGLLRGETAVALISHSDFMQAASMLWPVAHTYWGDFAYLAERVLTTTELKGFVDAHAAAPLAQPAGEGVIAVNRLRALLARRLMRDGRYAESLGYFDHLRPDDPDTRANAASFAEAVNRGKGAFFATDRAIGAWNAAVLLRGSGMELMGTETAPDQAALDGEFEAGYGPNGPPPAPDWRGESVMNERVRYDASRALPDLRFHYRYLAAEQALAAADNLPPRSQAFAAVLCQAAGWMMSSDADERAQAIYARYVREGALVPFAAHFGHDCPEPDFGAVSGTRWRVWRVDARDTVHRRKLPVVAGGVFLLLVVGGGMVWMRRRA